MKTIKMLVALLIFAQVLPAQTKTNKMETTQNGVTAFREYFNTLGNSYAPDNTVKVTGETIAGVSSYWFTPASYNEDNIIIYLHGGMYGAGSIASHKALVSYVAGTLSTRVVFIDYALSPEHPYPQGLNDAFEVYKAIAARYPKARISIIGDSAGGGLSVSLVHKLVAEKVVQPASVILVSPWIYLDCNTPAYETRKTIEPILNKEQLLQYAGYYKADAGAQADPGQLQFDSFPPLFVLVGSREILFDDSRLFYEKIKQVQPNTKMKEYMDETHVWILTSITNEGSKTALADMKAFFAEATK